MEAGRWIQTFVALPIKNEIVENTGRETESDGDQTDEHTDDFQINDNLVDEICQIIVPAKENSGHSTSTPTQVQQVTYRGGGKAADRDTSIFATANTNKLVFSRKNNPEIFLSDNDSDNSNDDSPKSMPNIPFEVSDDDIERRIRTSTGIFGQFYDLLKINNNNSIDQTNGNVSLPNMHNSTTPIVHGAPTMVPAPPVPLTPLAPPEPVSTRDPRRNNKSSLLYNKPAALVQPEYTQFIPINPFNLPFLRVPPYILPQLPPGPPPRTIRPPLPPPQPIARTYGEHKQQRQQQPLQQPNHPNNHPGPAYPPKMGYNGNQFTPPHHYKPINSSVLISPPIALPADIDKAVRDISQDVRVENPSPDFKCQY